MNTFSQLPLVNIIDRGHIQSCTSFLLLTYWTATGKTKNTPLTLPFVLSRVTYWNCVRSSFTILLLTYWTDKGTCNAHVIKTHYYTGQFVFDIRTDHTKMSSDENLFLTSGHMNSHYSTHYFSDQNLNKSVRPFSK